MSNPGSAAPKPGGEAIPMLTEIVEVPAYSAENLPATLRDINWDEVAARVRRQVSEHLADRIGAILDLELNKALQSADLKQKFAGEGSEPSVMSREQFTKFVANEIVRWRIVAQDSGIKPE